MVEHLTVAQDVAGSCPVSHPKGRLTTRVFRNNNLAALTDSLSARSSDG